MLFWYQIALECKILGRTHSPSLYSTADVYSLSSGHSWDVRGNGGREGAVDLEEGTQYIGKFFEGLLRHPVLMPKTVGATLVGVFAVILPVEATTSLVDAPPDIRSEHGVCNT